MDNNLLNIHFPETDIQQINILLVRANEILVEEKTNSKVANSLSIAALLLSFTIVLPIVLLIIAAPYHFKSKSLEKERFNIVQQIRSIYEKNNTSFLLD